MNRPAAGHAAMEPAEHSASGRARTGLEFCIWRKLSFGTQSPGGSRFVETMLTVIETCRQQSRNVFAYVTSAVQMHFSQQPIPSLLPRL
jgi:transposase